MRDDPPAPVVTIALRLEASAELTRILADLARAAFAALGLAPTPPPVANAPAPDPLDPPRHGAWITPARDAVLRETIPTMTPIGAIAARVNALPGPPAKTGLIRLRAYALGLRRPEGFVAPATLEKLARMRAARSGAAKPDPLPPVGSTQADGLAAGHAGGARPSAPPADPGPATDPDTSLGARARILPAHKPPAAIPAAPPIAAPVAAPVAREPLLRKPATREQIIAFCAGRGKHFDTFDLAVINRWLGGLGHPGFDLIDPLVRRAGRG